MILWGYVCQRQPLADSPVVRPGNLLKIHSQGLFSSLYAACQAVTHSLYFHRLRTFPHHPFVATGIKIAVAKTIIIDAARVSSASYYADGLGNKLDESRSV